MSAPWKQIGHASKAKVVYRARVDGRPVIVKQNRKSGDGGGTTLYMELVYLESLRGRPGVPELLGAWWEASRLTYATVDGGEPISGIDDVPPSRTGARRFATWAQKRPLQLARSLLACFWSWASAGCAEIKIYGAFVLNRRVVLHAIEQASRRWRGDAGSSPLDLVKNCRVHPTHWLISTQVGRLVP